MSQLPAKQVKKPTFSVALQTTAYQKTLSNAIADKMKREQFVTAITSAVANNPALQGCDASTVLSSALLGEGLNLTPSPQLGQYYLVPFNDKKRGKVANFILGYRGYIQLAIRSGFYKKINVVEIKKGELKSYNPLTEEIDVDLIQDFDKREEAETVGYYAMFEYQNGFVKAIYWQREKMMSHADKYSPAFSKVSYKKLLNDEIPQKDRWKYSSFWYKDFDSMAKKTMLRQLISKWGIMSAEMQRAYTIDNEQQEEYSPVEDDAIIIEHEEVSFDDVPDSK